MFSKKKLKCPKCGKTKKQRCFVFNKKTKDKICKQCDKAIGNNMFYVELKERNSDDKVSKYGMSWTEKKAQHGQLVSQGLDSEEAWRRINRDAYYLKTLRTRNNQIRKNFAIMAEQERKKTETQRKAFLEGLNG